MRDSWDGAWSLRGDLQSSGIDIGATSDSRLSSSDAAAVPNAVAAGAASELLTPAAPPPARSAAQPSWGAGASRNVVPLPRSSSRERLSGAAASGNAVRSAPQSAPSRAAPPPPAREDFLHTPVDASAPTPGHDHHHHHHHGDGDECICPTDDGCPCTFWAPGLSEPALTPQGAAAASVASWDDPSFDEPVPLEWRPPTAAVPSAALQQQRRHALSQLERQLLEVSAATERLLAGSSATHNLSHRGQQPGSAGASSVGGGLLCASTQRKLTQELVWERTTGAPYTLAWECAESSELAGV